MLRYKRPPQIQEEEEELEVKPSPIIRLFGILVVLAFAALTYNLYQIQVVQGKEYTQAAEENRIRLIRTNAARGILYDRNGTVLVRNEPQFNVTIVPADLPVAQQEEILKKLSVLIDAPLNTTIEADTTDALGALASDVSRTFISPTRRPGLRELVNEGRNTDPLTPVLVKTNIPRLIAFQLQEQSDKYPGVRVEIEPVRTYPEGTLTAHLLGYLGAISSEAFTEYEKRGYQQNDLVGVTGLEATYEDQLRGRSGTELAIVDANGNIVTSREQEAPVPGNNVILSLDLELQKQVEAALKKGMATKNAKQGVAIVMNPNNGEILAMVSLPTYDDNLFARGIKATDFNALNQDKDRPLINHAISGMYPPGSVYKLFSAAGALQEGVIDQNTQLFDPGIIYLPNKFFPDDPKLAQPFYNWYRPGFGFQNIIDAIANSNDIFFYKLDGGFTDFPTPLGQALVAEYARLFGYGALSGIDLPGEAPGLVPDPKWKQQTLNEQWTTGDTYNMAIGQGFVLATPLQVLDMTATIANGGTLYRPHLARAIVNATGTVTNTIEPQVIRHLPIDAKNFALVRQGMREAVTRGTAWKVNFSDLAVAAKTGTAEFFGPKVNGHLPTHAWFTAFAPYDKPEIAVVVFVFGAGEGSEVAAPIAADILRAYFKLPADAQLVKPAAPPPPETRNAGLPAAGAAPPPAAPPTNTFSGRVTQVQDNAENPRPSIAGTVVNAAGQGVSGITVVLESGDGKVVASSVTGADGVFRFDKIEIQAPARWFVRLTGAANSQGVAVDLAPNKLFTIQFTGTTP
jgi:penicillin-binding protein 2